MLGDNRTNAIQGHFNNKPLPYRPTLPQLLPSQIATKIKPEVLYWANQGVENIDLLHRTSKNIRHLNTLL